MATQQEHGSGVTYAGWVFKEGSLVKSWKKRFLVVKGAELAYYKNTEQENKAQLLGAMTVARIEKVGDITNGLLVTSVEGRQLKLFTDTQRECDKCFHAIAQYARKQRGGDGSRTPHNSSSSSSSTPYGSHKHSDAITHVGWLEKEGQHFKTWKKRYFVLEENTLSYSAQIGSASLGKSRVIATRRDLTRPYTLVVMFEGGRELKIGGKTEAEIHEWHKALRRAIMKYGGHRSPGHRSPAQSPATMTSPAQRAPPHGQSARLQHVPRAPPNDPYSQPPPAYMEHVASSRSTDDSQDYSPLFGSLPGGPGDRMFAPDEPPLTPTPHFSDEQQRNMAARQNRDLAASFRRHIIVDATPENGASFIEVEPERDAVKPWSPKAPGANTIMHMRLEDKLLLEELEEERQEALLKEKALLGDATEQKKKKQEALHGPCCCVVM